MLEIRIEKPSKELMYDYSKLSIAFDVQSVYQLERVNSGLKGIKFTEVNVKPYSKDYDSVTDNPGTLMDGFNLSNWHVVSAFKDDVRVGGALLAYDTKEINMLEGRDDLTVLWDIRIDKNFRHQGIGHQLVNACKVLSTELNCKRIKIETQNNNVKACQFYENQSAVLTSFTEHCYKEYPDEIQLIWSLYL